MVSHCRTRSPISVLGLVYITDKTQDQGSRDAFSRVFAQLNWHDNSGACPKEGLAFGGAMEGLPDTRSRAWHRTVEHRRDALLSYSGMTLLILDKGPQGLS